MEQVFEKGCTHKINKKRVKISTSKKIQAKDRKSTYIEGKKFDCFFIIGKIYFFGKIQML